LFKPPDCLRHAYKLVKYIEYIVIKLQLAELISLDLSLVGGAAGALNEAMQRQPSMQFAKNSSRDRVLSQNEEGGPKG
jgi:hypothetical protein